MKPEQYWRECTMHGTIMFSCLEHRNDMSLASSNYFLADSNREMRGADANGFPVLNRLRSGTHLYPSVVML